MNIDCDGCTWKPAPQQGDKGISVSVPISYEPEEVKEQADEGQERRIDLEKMNLPDDHFLTQYVKWGESVTDAYREYHISNGL